MAEVPAHTPGFGQRRWSNSPHLHLERRCPHLHLHLHLPGGDVQCAHTYALPGRATPHTQDILSSDIYSRYKCLTSLHMSTPLFFCPALTEEPPPIPYLPPFPRELTNWLSRGVDYPRLLFICQHYQLSSWLIFRSGG